MIVLTIIAVLVTIALPFYRGIVIRSRESVLKANLHHMRDVIDQYTADKKKAPQSLQDLVDGHYYRELPLDPITGSHDTWQTEFGTDLSSPDQTDSGITNVHSGAPGISTEGTQYSTW